MTIKNWLGQFTLYDAFDEDATYDFEDNVKTYSRYILITDSYYKGKNGNVLVNVSIVLTSNGNKIIERSRDEMWQNGYKCYNEKEYNTLTDKEPNKYLYKKNLSEYLKVVEQYNYWKKEQGKHSNSPTSNEWLKYYDEVMVRFRKWFTTHGLEIPNEIKEKEINVPTSKNVGLGRKKNKRLMLPANKREKLNDSIVDFIEVFIDRGKGSLDQAFIELSKKSKSKLKYILSPKAIEGRYKRNSERYIRIKNPRT